MYGSSYAGNAVGGAVLGVVAARVSLQFAFLVLAIAVAAIMMIPLFLRERRGDRFLGLRAKITTEKLSDTPEDEGPSSMAEVMRDLVRAFSTIPTLAGVGLALLASMTTGLLAAFMPTLCIQELSWSQEEYAAITGSIAFVGLGGSIAGGFLADLVGPRRLAAIAGLLTAALWVVFALTPEYWSIRGSIITFMVLETILGSVFSVSLFALFMGVSWKRMAASQFTAYMAMLNLSRVIGAGLATKVKDDLNYSEIFLLAAVIITIAVMVLPLVSQARAQGIFRRWDRSL
jgi:PAT family beta-lactamase induction signal transducer AmpG